MGEQATQRRVLPPFKRAVIDDTDTSPTMENSAVPPENDFAFFGLAHNQVSSAGFKIIFAAGNIAAIFYHDIVSPITYDGIGIIELRTPSLVLNITGKNLNPLFDHLFENRVAWIMEPDASFTQVGEGQPEIETITLQLKE
jgi:hypothetical protein